MKYHYVVHLSSGNLIFDTLKEAKRQAKNLARAAQQPVQITQEVAQ